MLAREFGRSMAFKAVIALVAFWALAFSIRQYGIGKMPAIPTSMPGRPSTAGGHVSHVEYFGGPLQPKFTDRAAVLIEDRPLASITPVMLHFLSVLGPRWPMILYTRNASAEILMQSATLRAAVEDHRVEIRFLPDFAVLSNHHAISVFLADTWLWEDLAPYEKLFFFQLDSIICSNSKYSVNDFLKYDIIGAPIPENLGRGYNGGLSIRNREMTLRMFKEHSYVEDYETPNAPVWLRYEDQWLYTKMKEYIPEAKFPSQDDALKFSIEFIWADQPFGWHQADRVNGQRMEEIVKYCPEIALARPAEALSLN